jgi:toxin YoeB
MKKINTLIKEIERTPFEGSGKPEPLKHNLSGWWSRRINLEHRLVYKIENDTVIISQCRFHY